MAPRNLLKPSTLPLLLEQANDRGNFTQIRTSILFNNSGELLGCAGNENDAVLVAAIVSSAWTSYAPLLSNASDEVLEDGAAAAAAAAAAAGSGGGTGLEGSVVSTLTGPSGAAEGGSGGPAADGTGSTPSQVAASPALAGSFAPSSLGAHHHPVGSLDGSAAATTGGGGGGGAVSSTPGAGSLPLPLTVSTPSSLSPLSSTPGGGGGGIAAGGSVPSASGAAAATTTTTTTTTTANGAATTSPGTSASGGGGGAGTAVVVAQPAANKNKVLASLIIENQKGAIVVSRVTDEFVVCLFAPGGVNLGLMKVEADIIAANLAEPLRLVTKM